MSTPSDRRPVFELDGERRVLVECLEEANASIAALGAELAEAKREARAAEQKLIARRGLPELVDEIGRLRRLAPIPVDRQSVLEHLRQEIEEVEHEDPHSDRARSEAGDVLAVAIHLCLVEGVDPREALRGQLQKLRSRLDLVEAGHTWDEAKILLAASADDPPG